MKMTADAVVEEVKIRPSPGRGWGGFPAGLEMEFY
jgi:NADH:ubiquinone oxidoreductase subunit F (NADH-binding)